MGLFGGFKAKFTKDSTAKSSKSTKNAEVVCLGYRVYSEFDNPPQYLQTSPERSKPPPPKRTLAPRLKSATKNEESNPIQPSTSTQINTQIDKTPKVKKSSKKKTSQTEKKHLSTASLPLTNSHPEEQSNTESLNRAISSSHPNITTETVTLRNGSVREGSKSAPNSIYTRGKTSSFNPNINEISSSRTIDQSPEAQEVDTKPPKSILKQSTTYIEVNDQGSNTISTPKNNTVLTTDENIYSDAEYDRTMTVGSSKTSKSNGYTTETVDYLSATQAVTKSSTTQVNTYVHAEVSSSKNEVALNKNHNSNVQYGKGVSRNTAIRSPGSTNKNVTYDQSKDGRNKTETTLNSDDSSGSYYAGGYSSYTTSTRSIGNTSNHAASIFFGGDEEPEIHRPRRTNAVVESEDAEC